MAASLQPRLLVGFLMLALLCLLVATVRTAPAVDKKGQPTAEDMKPLMKEWDHDVRVMIADDDKLKALAAKYPLVVLHSRHHFWNSRYLYSSFSFIKESNDEAVHGGTAHLMFHNGGEDKSMSPNMVVGQDNLLVDLGEVDFTKDPEPKKISIDDERVKADNCPIATTGHVYLERIRDDDGNNFYVVFQVIFVDPNSRCMAFVWRKLPGGKRAGDKNAPNDKS